VRAVLGSAADRVGPLGIEGNIENTAKVLRNVRSIAVDNGLKIAIENHAGDMQARELKTLIEEAGKDFVGACLDSGNPLWTLEDPHLTLETLAPYVLTSHVRDTSVWREKDRIAVEWVRMGEGNVGIREYTRRFQELCPGRPFSLEVIVTQPRYFAYGDPNFWEPYRKTPAWEFARFLSLADKGAPHAPIAPPASKEAGVEREREDLEASIRFAHDELGI
jgi:sugar phosphate isomerase/epimerase